MPPPLLGPTAILVSPVTAAGLVGGAAALPVGDADGAAAVGEAPFQIQPHAPNPFAQRGGLVKPRAVLGYWRQPQPPVREPESPAAPPALTPKISFSDSRQILLAQLKQGPLTPRKVYGQTVEVLGMKVTLRSVLTRFWVERRSQLIAEGKLNTTISVDPLNEEVLDIIHFDLTGKLRVRSRWNSDRKKKWIPLKIAPGQFMSNPDTLEGAYSLLRLISLDRRLMKGAQRFPADRDNAIVVYNPHTGQFVQYAQLLKTAHAHIARAIAGRDYRVALFGTYDRERPDPRQPVYGPSGVPVATRNLPFVERVVNSAVVRGQRSANIPNEDLRIRMWQWVQRYGDQLPQMALPVRRRSPGLR